MNITVIWPDVQLLIREKNGKEIVKFFFAGIRRIFLTTFHAHMVSGSCPVMSIRDIQIWNFFKFFLKTENRAGIVDFPYGMADIVFCSEVINWCIGVHPVFHGIGNALFGTIGKKNRARIGIAGIYVMNAVRLFIGPSQFVLFNDVFFIVIDRNTADQTNLDATIHNFSVYVKAGSIILDINAMGTHLF